MTFRRAALGNRPAIERQGYPSLFHPAERRRLLALVKDRNAAQKHVCVPRLFCSALAGHECNYASDRQVEDLRPALAKRFAMEGFEGSA
jgi:hypothetical protein